MCGPTSGAGGIALGDDTVVMAHGHPTTPTRKEPTMASTQTLRVDAYGLLPSLLIALMLILAALGVIAHAASL